MITWLTGENSFEVREALKAIETSFEGTPERVDGSELHLADLPDLLMGVSLFSSRRLVIISNLSTNASVWEKLPDWLSRVNDDIHLVFVDTKPDKRTTSYKALKSVATLQEFPSWSERDAQKAEQWVSARAKTQGVQLDTKTTQHLIARVGLDQWQLANAITTLSLVDEATIAVVDSVIPLNAQENVFQLFEAALDTNPRRVSEIVKTLTTQEDPYALFALLTSQVLTLAAVTYADGDAQPTKDFAIHPYVASKLTRHGKRLGKGRVGHIVELFAQTDAEMKRSKAAPWLLIERTLLKVAQ